MYANTQRFVFICLTPTLYGFSRIWKSVFSYFIAKLMIVLKFPNGLGRKSHLPLQKPSPLSQKNCQPGVGWQFMEGKIFYVMIGLLHIVLYDPIVRSYIINGVNHTSICYPYSSVASICTGTFQPIFQTIFCRNIRSKHGYATQFGTIFEHFTITIISQSGSRQCRGSGQ